MKVPTSTQDEVRKYLILIQATQDQQAELAKFLDMISPSLKQKVAVSIFSTILKRNKRFDRVFTKRYDEMLASNALLNKRLKENPLLRDKVMHMIITEVVSKLTTTLARPEDVIIQ